MAAKKKKYVVAITGASGSIYGIRLLEELKKNPDIECHLVLSKWGAVNIAEETDYSVRDVTAMADAVYANDQLNAKISSGSFRHNGMVIVPCSMKTVSAISSGYGDTLIARAADVCLKERFPLLLAPRETPLHQIHLRNLLTLAEAGAIIMPPMPIFYACPQSVNDIVDYTVGRMLQTLGIENDLVRIWTGEGHI